MKAVACHAKVNNSQEHYTCNNSHKPEASLIWHALPQVIAPQQLIVPIPHNPTAFQGAPCTKQHLNLLGFAVTIEKVLPGPSTSISMVEVS